MRARLWIKTKCVESDLPGTLEKKSCTDVKVDDVVKGSTAVKFSPDSYPIYNQDPHSIGKSRGGWTTKHHLIALGHNA